jgi:hypothetical protein
MARRQRELILENEFDMRIASLTEFPAMSPAFFELLVEKSDKRCTGVYLEIARSG